MKNAAERNGSEDAVDKLYRKQRGKFPNRNQAMFRHTFMDTA